MAVWLVWIWTFKNADEKAHTFLPRSKNVKKRTITDEKGYCVNSPLGYNVLPKTFSLIFVNNVI